MEKLMYDISKKSTENGENDRKPKFVDNFRFAFCFDFLKRANKLKVEYIIFPLGRVCRDLTMWKLRNLEFLLWKTSIQNLSAIGIVVSELLSVKDRLVGAGRVGSKFFFVDFESKWPEMKNKPQNPEKFRILNFGTLEVDNLTTVRL